MDLLEDDEAVELMRSRLRETASQQDWRLWATPACSILVAVAAVLLEQLLAQFWRNRRPRAAHAQDPFMEGAKQLVRRAFVRCLAVKRLWRFIEVWSACNWFGTATITMNPMWWLPLVALLYCVPAAIIHGPQKVFRRPVLAIATTSLASQLAAVARHLTLLLVFAGTHHYFSETGSTARAVSSWGWAPASWYPWITNPLYDIWYLERTQGSWTHINKSLQSDWLLHWAGPVTTLEIWVNVYRGVTNFVSFWTYPAYLLIIILWQLLAASRLRCLRRCTGLVCATGPNEARDQESLERAALDLLQKQSAEFCEVDAKIRPIRGFGCPWRDFGLYQSMVLMFTDVGLDVATVVAFLRQEQYILGAITAFVVARSVLKQMYIVKPWCLWQASCICDAWAWGERLHYLQIIRIQK